MFLIFCSAADQSALWVYAQLRRFGITPLQVVTTELLSYAGWNHQVGASGSSITITLPDGRVIDSRQIKGVLNRITTIGADQANRATQIDREYALSELNAFYLSWLYCLPGTVINRATPQGLCGRWRHPSEWTALASEAGLPVRRYRQSEQDAPGQIYNTAAIGASRTKALVFRSRIFGAQLPASTTQAACRFAQLAGLDLMSIDFEIDSGNDTVFAGASPIPELFSGGEELIGALAQSWQSKEEVI